MIVQPETVSSSDEKLARAREHGTDETINYREHDNWESIVRDLTGDRGVDLTLEVGGEGTFAKSMTATRPTASPPATDATPTALSDVPSR